MYCVLEMDPEQAVMASFEEANPGHDLKWLMGSIPDTDTRPAGLRIMIDEPDDEYEEPEAESADGNAGPAYPDYFELMRVPIGSTRLKEALTRAGVDNIEYYPVPIVDLSGQTVQGHYAMNIIGRLTCIDRAKSALVTDGGQIVRIKSLTLDTQKIHGAKVFRLHEYPEITIVSSDVADALHEMSGVLLLPAQGWSDEHRF